MGKNLKGREIGSGYSQRKDGRYTYRYTDINGMRHDYYDTNLSALKRKVANEIEEEKRLIRKSTNTTKTFNDLYLEARKGYLKLRYKATTLYNFEKTYENNIQKSYLSNASVYKTRPSEVQEFLFNLKDTYTIMTLRNIKTILSGILDFAVLEGIIPFNYMKSIKVISNVQSKEVKPVLMEDYNKFVEYIHNDSIVNMYDLIMNTGLRIGEVCGLTKDDVDFDKNVIYIRKAIARVGNDKGDGLDVVFSKPKFNKERAVPMNENARDILIREINKEYEAKDSKFKDLVFITKKGLPYTNNKIQSAISNACKAAAKKNICLARIHPHALRHTFATNCIKSGLSPNVVKEILGHNGIETTMNIYVKENVNYVDLNNIIFQ